MDFPTQDLNATFEKVALEDGSLTQPTTKNDNSNSLLAGVQKNTEAGPTSCHSSPTVSFESFPPRTISVPLGESRPHQIEPTIGYVQLCYDHRQGLIIPMMEVSVDGRSKAAKRVPFNTMTPEAFPPLCQATGSPSQSSCTISTITSPDGLISSDDDEDYYSNFDPILLGEDLHIYLLQDHLGIGATCHQVDLGCSDVFQKLIEARSKMIRSLKRSRNVKDPTKGDQSKRLFYQPMSG